MQKKLNIFSGIGGLGLGGIGLGVRPAIGLAGLGGIGGYGFGGLGALGGGIGLVGLGGGGLGIGGLGGLGGGGLGFGGIGGGLGVGGLGGELGGGGLGHDDSFSAGKHKKMKVNFFPLKKNLFIKIISELVFEYFPPDKMQSLNIFIFLNIFPLNILRI